MRVNYDKNKDALSIRFSRGSYDQSREVEDGIIFDYDKKKKLVGIEVLDASRRLDLPLSLSRLAPEVPLEIEIKSRSRS